MSANLRVESHLRDAEENGIEVLVVKDATTGPGPEAAREAMLGMGLPEWFVDALNEYNMAFSEGFGDFTTNDVEEITGHPARSYETFARDFAQAFVSAGAPAP